MKARRGVDQPTNQRLADTCNFAAEELHDMHPKKDSVCSEDISKMGLVVGFKLRLARSNCFA